MPIKVPNMTHRGKRVVNVSIILSYILIPSGVLAGISPDTFAVALHKILEFLEVGITEEGAATATIGVCSLFWIA